MFRGLPSPILVLYWLLVPETREMQLRVMIAPTSDDYCSHSLLLQSKRRLDSSSRSERPTVTTALDQPWSPGETLSFILSRRMLRVVVARLLGVKSFDSLHFLCQAEASTVFKKEPSRALGTPHVSKTRRQLFSNTLPKNYRCRSNQWVDSGKLVES